MADRVTKAEFRRASLKSLHAHGEPLPDGRLALDVEAFERDMMEQLDTLQLTPKRDDRDHEDHEEGDELEGYDPVAEGKARAKKQIGERERARDALR